MTIEEVNKAIKQYKDTVTGKPFSKDMTGRLIQGFSLREISTDNYELSVVGQDLTHIYAWMTTPLEEWLKDNNEL